MTDEEISSRLSGCVLGEDRGTFTAGTAFGDWRITAFIAKGGTAEVYCAEHAVLGTSAAVKVLSEPLTDSRKARFLREAKLLAELKSPSFPAFHGYGEANGRPYIAEELLEPGELPAGDRPRAKYLLALCEGLKALHAKGVVHRDLKPANILFRKTGEPVIVDLGLAKSVDVPLVPDGVSIVDGKAVGVGTPEYAAPEQFTGGDITPAADVHALGVLAEKLLGDQMRLRKWRSGNPFRFALAAHHPPRHEFHCLRALPVRRCICRGNSAPPLAAERDSCWTFPCCGWFVAWLDCRAFGANAAKRA